MKKEPPKQKTAYLICALISPILFLNNRVQTDLVLVVLVTLIIVPRLCTPQKYFFVFVALHFVWFCKNPLSPLNSNPFGEPISLHALYRDGVIFLLLTWGLVFIRPRIFPILHVLIIFSALWFLLWRIGVLPSSGISGTKTLDACFIALGSVYFKKYLRFILAGISLLGLSTSPALVLLVLYVKRKILWPTLAVIGTLLVLRTGFDLRADDRIYVWAQMIRHLWLTETWVLGNGLGSFNSLGGLFDSQAPLKYLAAHNEFIQMIFEYGVIGYGLFLWVIVDFYKKADPFKRSVLEGLAVICLFNSPFRQAVYVLFLL